MKEGQEARTACPVLPWTVPCGSAFLCTGDYTSRSRLQGKDVKFRFELDVFGPDEIQRGSALVRDTSQELKRSVGGICQGAGDVWVVVEAMAIVEMDEGLYQVRMTH